VCQSGLFVTVSCIWERLKDEHEVDVFQTVKQLRFHRPQVIINLVCLNQSASVVVTSTRPLLTNKPQAFGIVITARLPLENNFNVLHTEIYIFDVTADDTSLVISDVLLTNRSTLSCTRLNLMQCISLILQLS